MKTSRSGTRRLTQLALLTAVVLVMAYTPLGYLPLGPLNLSLLTVPVAIGAMLLGPVDGAILGGVFGITSFLNAVEGKSSMGAALFAASPVGYFVVAVAARVLMGFLCGAVYLAAKKLLGETSKAACAVGGVSAPLLNTLFYMGLLVVIFYGNDYVQNRVSTLGAVNPVHFILLMVGFQAVIEAVVCCAVAAAVTVPLKKILKQ